MPKFVCKRMGVKFNGKVLKYNEIITSDSNPDITLFREHISVDTKKSKKKVK